jgi:SAM-dependent methyltransferase
MADRLGVLMEQRDELTPPGWMFSDPDRVDRSHDLREFISIGNATIAWFIEEGLAPVHRVLDVGCGIGRMALPLTKHLVRGGTYNGIEIAPWKVRYCRTSIGKRRRNFRFHHADVFNKYYNPIDSGCAKVHRQSWRYLSQCWKAQECAIALRA